MCQHKKTIILCILLIFFICFSGCNSNKPLVTNHTADTIIHSDSITETKVENNLNDKVNYKKLLPDDYDWNIAKTITVNLNAHFTIVGAYCERDKKPMLGQFFVFSGDKKLLWKSTEFETSSVLDEGAYIVKDKDKALVFGEYVWGGARGMMYSGVAFTIDSNNVVKEVNRDILLGLNGDVTITNNSILLEGDSIENKLELSIVGGIYKENQESEIYTITHIEKWQHPVKKVFDNYSITLKKVELLKNKTYPVFYLDYSGGLLDECYYSDLLKIAKANGYWSYKLVDEEDNISVEVDCDTNNKKLLKATIYTQETNGDKTNTKKDIDEYHVNVNNHNKLNNKDFDVKISGLKITKYMSVGDITEKIGCGTANEDNNYGYVGRSPDGHQRHKCGYNENNVNYDLISLDEGDLERIDIDSTIRGLHTGDSLNKLIDLYGNADFEILKGVGRYSEYVYAYNDMQFVLGISDNKIEYMSLQFMNLYEF